jgi:purine-binding chemotaxis protein CheW
MIRNTLKIVKSLKKIMNREGAMKQFLIFTSSGQQFALEIKNISKIIEYIVPREIPESSDFILGVIPYNESILPVISLSTRLYGKESDVSDERKVIVTLWKGKEIGFVVEDIVGIRTVEESDIEPSNKELKISRDYIEGYIKDGESIIIILEISKIFSVDQEKELLSMELDQEDQLVG